MCEFANAMIGQVYTCDLSGNCLYCGREFSFVVRAKYLGHHSLAEGVVDWFEAIDVYGCACGHRFTDFSKPCDWDERFVLAVESWPVRQEAEK